MRLFQFQFTATADPTSLYSLYDVAKGNDAGTTTYLGFKGTVEADAGNGGNLTLTMDGNTVPLAAGKSFTVEGCDIGPLLISGNGDKLNLRGNTADGWGPGGGTAPNY